MLDFSLPKIHHLQHEGTYIGFVDSRNEPTFFETHPKDLIRKKFRDGVGVVLDLAYHPQIKLYKFVYMGERYSITKERFIAKGEVVKLGSIVKWVCHITECTKENDRQLKLWGRDE